MQLSKAGYGTPKEILAMDVDIVISAVQYETFLAEYESTIIEMNKGG